MARILKLAISALFLAGLLIGSMGQTIKRPVLNESFLNGFNQLEVNEVVKDNLGGGPPEKQRCYSAKVSWQESERRIRRCLDGRLWGSSGWTKEWTNDFACYWHGKGNGPFRGWTIALYRNCSRPTFSAASDLIVSSEPEKGWSGITIDEPMGPSPKLRMFASEDVTLNDSLIKRQIDDAKTYYLSIPNDDLLLGFRRRAGLPHPGKELGGWYSDDVFHVFGQILSGLSLLYAATGDKACKAKAEVLESEWAKCIEKDGYFFYSRKPNAPHYIYDKMVGGLVDMMVFLQEFGHDQKLETDLSRITEWATKNLDRTRPFGGDSNEWYTLSENLYRAYFETCDRKYGDFAKVWEYTKYWDLFAANKSIFPEPGKADLKGVYHAYSHVNTLGGAGQAYFATGEKHYLDTLIHAYDFLQKDECYATGGYGADEGLWPHGSVVEHLATTPNTFETQCGSWAAFKMSKYLQTITGEARYGDWIEKLAYNGVCSTTPMTPDGKVLYYSDYNLFGGQKQNIGWGWSCCTGTRPMAAAVLKDLIYFHNNWEEVYVNLFVPSELQLRSDDDANVRLVQKTRFPEDSRVVFDVHTRKPLDLTLKLRRPGWLVATPKATLNGKSVSLIIDANGWLTIERQWKDEDELIVDLPMSFRTIPIDPEHPFPAATAYGPTILCIRSDAQPGKKIDWKNFPANFRKSPGEPLTFHLKSDPSVLVRPFYAFKDGEPYFMYLDPGAPNRITRTKLKFTGSWNNGATFHYCDQIGATCEATFDGTGVRWLGLAFDDAGKVRVEIDGKQVAVVDQYGPGRGLPFDWSYNGLTPGKHTIKFTILPVKNEKSTGTYMNISGLEIT